MQPLGTPVVPDVNAMRPTSSEAVGHAAKARTGRASARSSRSGASPPQVRTPAIVGASASAAESSSSRRASQSAALHRLFCITTRSSVARSMGIVVTATMPALRTASHVAAIHGPLKPRSSTR